MDAVISFPEEPEALEIKYLAQGHPSLDQNRIELMFEFKPSE